MWRREGDDELASGRRRGAPLVLEGKRAAPLEFDGQPPPPRFRARGVEPAAGAAARPAHPQAPAVASPVRGSPRDAGLQGRGCGRGTRRTLTARSGPLGPTAARRGRPPRAQQRDLALAAARVARGTRRTGSRRGAGSRTRSPVWMSLSMPRGPNVVRTASTMAWQALMLLISWPLPWLVSTPSRSRMICGCSCTFGFIMAARARGGEGTRRRMGLPPFQTTRPLRALGVAREASTSRDPSGSIGVLAGESCGCGCRGSPLSAVRGAREAKRSERRWRPSGRRC